MFEPLQVWGCGTETALSKQKQQKNWEKSDAEKNAARKVWISISCMLFLEVCWRKFLKNNNFNF